MELPLIADGARLPTLALMVSMALAGAVAAADDGVKTSPTYRPDSKFTALPTCGARGSLLRANTGVFHRIEL
jgi:hypothetical protein